MNTESSNITISVLMSLYEKEHSEYLHQALLSLTGSDYPIDEVVVVLDGPIPDELHTVLNSFRKNLPLKSIPLAENGGLGKALNAGLAHCQNEWVARFDTDDIIAPQRFTRQVTAIINDPDIDILGSWVSEFTDDPAISTGTRRVPVEHEDIKRYAQCRSPFNHMSVMYKRSKVFKCGGYKNESLYEDYALWVRMLQAGAKTHNVPECLVHARGGNSMVARRGGWKYAINELKFQYNFLVNGFISLPRFTLNLLQRIPVRLAPLSLRKTVYNTLLRK